jgi:4-methyl-5(b-hydroxyethyl)-thiazole monophosphate biosynthesis
MPEGRLQCKMSRGLKVVADVSIEACKDITYDCIALPGGMPGAERLRDCEVLKEMLLSHHASGRLTSAVCASPAVVFDAHGLLPASATCYPAPAFKEKVSGWTDAAAVVDGNVVTSQGPGTSLQFALKLVEILYDKAKAEEIATQMLTTTA